jgi:hypothetical protein
MFTCLGDTERTKDYLVSVAGLSYRLAKTADDSLPLTYVQFNRLPHCIVLALGAIETDNNAGSFCADPAYLRTCVPDNLASFSSRPPIFTEVR